MHWPTVNVVRKILICCCFSCYVDLSWWLCPCLASNLDHQQHMHWPTVNMAKEVVLEADCIFSMVWVRQAVGGCVLVWPDKFGSPAAHANINILFVKNLTTLKMQWAVWKDLMESAKNGRSGRPKLVTKGYYKAHNHHFQKEMTLHHFNPKQQSTSNQPVFVWG